MMVATPAPLLKVGRYSVHSAIANGGTARLHLGRLEGDAGFARIVAVKRLHPQLVQDPELVKMLIDEARLAARIQHVNVVQTLDVVMQDSEVFIVMDYLRGESLARLWRRMRDRGQQIPCEIACAIAVHTLRGLHAAHEAHDEMGRPLSLVHRDVSPQNVIVGADGVARLIDFGVAKATVRLQTTREGTLKGKLAYMAPEQVSGGASRLTDIWAAAVVLWECLTGQRLFYEESESKVFTRVLSQKVVAPSSIVRSLPRELDDILLCALSRVPAARFPTAEDMASAIERAVRIAPPPVVARWVKDVAGDLLTARDGLIASIESADAPPRRQEAERASAIFVTTTPLPPPPQTVDIPVIEAVEAIEAEPTPDTERRPSIFESEYGRQDTTSPSAQRRGRQTAVVAASLAAAIATFLGGVSVLVVGFSMHRAEIVPSAHAASAASIAPRESQLVGAKGVVYESAPVASMIDHGPPTLRAPSPPFAGARRQGPAPGGPVTTRTAASAVSAADEAGF